MGNNILVEQIIAGTLGTFWQSVNDFFNNAPSIFWAVVLGSITERISAELGRRNFNIIPLNDKSHLHQVIRFLNFFIRLMVAFLIGLFFLLIIIGIVAVISALIGYLSQ